MALQIGAMQCLRLCEHPIRNCTWIMRRPNHPNCKFWHGLYSDQIKQMKDDWSFCPGKCTWKASGCGVVRNASDVVVDGRLYRCAVTGSWVFHVISWYEILVPDVVLWGV